jgi:hypothetical protein
MVKCYFRNVRVPLKSFHIELLVANTVPALISEWTGKGYNYGYQHILAAFLGQVSNIIKAPASLNGSFSMPVDSGLSVLTLSSVGGFLATKAEAAWRLCATNSTTGWRDFFGQPFPG